MIYYGGCIVGVEILTGATYPGADSQKWMFNDGAFTPSTNSSVNSSSYSISLPPGGNAILYGGYYPVSNPESMYPTDAFRVRINNAYNSTLQNIEETSTKKLMVTNDDGLENATNNNYLQFTSSVSGSAPVRCSEVASAKIVELPYNQELVSYKRMRTAPSAVEVKTLDGVIRRAQTGKASMSVIATFKWSDNGTIAQKLDQILELSQVNLFPLILYIPAGIYYNGPFLDLVIPRNNPAVTMPAPGVYELTIEGDCQP